MAKIFELFLDYETTGFSSLELEDGKIVDKIREKGLLEVGAVLVTGDYKDILASVNLTIDPGDAYVNMNAATKKFHDDNGYTKIWETAKKRTCEEAEKRIIEMINRHVLDVTGILPAPVYEYSNDVQIVLAGRSVHTDRKWMDAFMPRLSLMLHHRHNDVSVLRSYLHNSDLKTGNISDGKPEHFALADARLALNDARCIQKLVNLGIESLNLEDKKYSSLEEALGLTWEDSL